MSHLPNQYYLKETICSLASIINNKYDDQAIHKLNQSSTFHKTSLNRTSTLPGLIRQESIHFKRRLPNIRSKFPAIKQKLLENTKNSKTTTGELKEPNITIKKFLQTPYKKKTDLQLAVNETLRDKIRIEISNCVDVKPQSTLSNFNNNYLVPMIVDLPIEQQKKKTRRKTSTAGSSSGSVNNSFEDPFYYANMIKSSNFSAFHTILDRKNEMVSNPFPYCSRIGKSPKKQLPVKLKPSPLLINLPECKCMIKNESEEEKFALPDLLEIKAHIPSLLKIFFYPQNVTCFRNLVIINFEGALGYFTSVLYIKTGALKVLQKLSKLFQLVLIVSLETSGKDEIVQKFSEKKIQLAGVYASHCPANMTREAGKLLNYSQIFADFDCERPNENCMIITSHRFAEEFTNTEKVISLHRGLGAKLNINRVPICSSEYPQSPCVVLLPDYNYCTEISVINEIAEVLAKSVKNFRAFRETFSFENFFKNSGFCLVPSVKPYHVLLDCLVKNIHQTRNNSEMAENYEKNLIGYCKLHSRYYLNYPKSNPVNLFVISCEKR